MTSELLDAVLDARDCRELCGCANRWPQSKFSWAMIGDDY
jgi:hypothetical protein